MTRTAATARVARARDFSNSLQSTSRDLSFDGAFRNKETGADERFVAPPIVARCVAVLANRRQQRVARQFRTVLSSWLKTMKDSFNCVAILPDDGGFGSRDIPNPFGQQRRGRHEHTTTRSLKPRLRQPLIFINLDGKPHVRAANHRCRTTNKTRLVRISDISRVEEMIRGYFG